MPSGPLARVEIEPLLAGGRSPHTLAARRQDAAHFAAWLAGAGLALDEIDELGVLAYRDACAATYAPATVNRRLSTLRLICRRLVDRGHLDRDPCRLVRGLVEPETCTPALTRGEVLALYAASEADRSPRGRRDHALIRFAVLTGLRKAELLAAVWCMFTFEREHRVYAYRAKGGVWRRTKITPSLAAELDAWHAELGDVRCCWPVIRGSRRVGWRFAGPLGRDGFDAMLARRAIAAGLGHVTPHVLRATHITLGLEAGCDVHRMARSVGHRSTATTLRYDSARDALDHASTDYLVGL